MRGDYLWLRKCLCCDGVNLNMITDFGVTPLPNAYQEAPTELPAYHLELMHCLDCKHFQLGGSAPPEDQFENYLYVSGTTKTLDDHFTALVEYCE